MAIICTTRSLKYSPSLVFLRLLNHESLSQKSVQFSTSKLLASKSSVPIKYTTSTASKVSIGENLGFTKIPELRNPSATFGRYVIIFSLSAFLIYFGILREENDIDEILKGNPDMEIKAKELYDLKIKLKFCQDNKLPTDALKAKIEELEKDKKITLPFRM